MATRHGQGPERPPQTICPVNACPLNKNMIEMLPQNKQGRARFSPTRGIAKGCKACKWPIDGRGCHRCVLAYTAHGVQPVL